MYAPPMELSERTPFLWTFICVTVTAPEFDAVRLIARTGTRAAAVVAGDCETTSEPATGLRELKETERPVAGGVTVPVPVPVPVPVVPVPVLIAFTNALVLGPKYPAAGEIPFAAWNAARAAWVKEPK